MTKMNIPGTLIVVSHDPGKRMKRMLIVLCSLVAEGVADKEIDILVELNKHNGKLTTESRREICKALDITSDYLNNYVKRMRKKKVIIGDDIHKSLKLVALPDDQYQLITFKFETHNEGHQ
jgi:hypothetical protein